MSVAGFDQTYRDLASESAKMEDELRRLQAEAKAGTMPADVAQKAIEGLQQSLAEHRTKIHGMLGKIEVERLLGKER